MELWVEHLCDKVAILLDSQFTGNSSAWYSSRLKELISYKNTKEHYDGLSEVTFRLGDWRVNFFHSPESGWSDCRYRSIAPQKTEFDNICVSFFNTLMLRLDETNYRLESQSLPKFSGMDDWIVFQLNKRNLL